ncbi:hypothetical protein GCM10017557_78290 [Streptomyces aurantiacus]|uniref:Uncharacterized protein n=1 Tax=Streptomyces aurantiacus TaxID=47760 RepID=A0A7G1PGJ5_9ACTN|nr:hypothetical protein GCM10017557_78290 [Streptomyces aurantiacus]
MWTLPLVGPADGSEIPRKRTIGDQEGPKKKEVTECVPQVLAAAGSRRLDMTADGRVSAGSWARISV